MSDAEEVEAKQSEDEAEQKVVTFKDLVRVLNVLSGNTCALSRKDAG